MLLVTFFEYGTVCDFYKAPLEGLGQLDWQAALASILLHIRTWY
jgi:hypothetical protein